MKKLGSSVAYLHLSYPCLAFGVQSMHSVTGESVGSSPDGVADGASGTSRVVKFSGTVKNDAGEPTIGTAGITFALYGNQISFYGSTTASPTGNSCGPQHKRLAVATQELARPQI